MQSIHQNTGWKSGNRTSIFLKRSLFFAFLYSTLLFILVRVFFYDFPFTVAEAVELYAKILLVVWAFIIACKLVIVAIVFIENSLDKMQVARLVYLPAFKKNLFILPASVLSINGGTKNTLEVPDTPVAIFNQEASTHSELIS